MILAATHLSKIFTDRPILIDESFSLDWKEKAALIGSNGSGKSTLLKILAGKEPAGGTLSLETKKIHLMEQNPEFSQETIWQEMMHQNRKLKNPKEDFELKSILTRLGFSDFDVRIDSLSGGGQKRLSLALALADEADLLLLDEPTNHLDESMCQWLEEWIRKSRQAILLVTHDRYFLENTTDKILELDKGRLYSFQGSYDSWLEARQTRLEMEEARMQKLNNIYAHELEWVKAGVQARSTKSKSRLQRFEQLRQQRSRQVEKQLELQLPSRRLGKKTLEWNNLAFAYPGGELLFENFSHVCTRSDRIGICGVNGCGKSTFFKILSGELEPTQGSVEFGSTVRLGFFRQNHEIEDLSMRVLDYIEETAREVTTLEGTLSASAMLEKFLFDKSQQYLPISRLSGGERRRLYLLKVLMEAPNVLLLDEPTNDLDLVTLNILEDMLDWFGGIVLVVSHDRYFLDRVCDMLFVHEYGNFRQVRGSYSQYLLDKQSAAQKPKIQEDGQKNQGWKKRSVRLSWNEKKELEALPSLLEQAEEEKNQIDQDMSSDVPYEQLAKLAARRDELDAQIEKMEARWLELEEKQEAAS